MEITTNGVAYPVIEVQSAHYFLCGGTRYKINYETSAAAVLTGDGGNVQQRLNLLERAITGQTKTYIVADIAARNNLAANTGDTVLVKDASADPTVESGSASYIREADGTWYKSNERESLDVELKWDDIKGRPKSAVADIDLAVAARHRHDNADVLAQLSAIGGKLAYAGKPVNPGLRWIVRARSTDEIDLATLADPCLVILQDPPSCDCDCDGCQNTEADGPYTYLYTNGAFEPFDIGVGEGSGGNGITISAAAFSVNDNGMLCVDESQAGGLAFSISNNGYLEAANG